MDFSPWSFYIFVSIPLRGRITCTFPPKFLLKSPLPLYLRFQELSSRWNYKRIQAGAGDQAYDYTIMSQVVFLPKTSQKISMREKSLLLNYSLASKDNITLAGDFCHRKDGMNFFLLFLSFSLFFVRISSFTFPFGCGVCLTLGFGNMTERRNSECHRWHIPHPFFRLSASLFWTPDWLWQPYIGDISYEREFANEMLMS